jgi:hypothetical protein
LACQDRFGVSVVAALALGCSVGVCNKK